MVDALMSTVFGGDPELRSRSNPHGPTAKDLEWYRKYFGGQVDRQLEWLAGAGWAVKPKGLAGRGVGPPGSMRGFS